ncbi:MAG: hypothetical protein LBP83_03835 [Dysgonamonadaceae bacterium]|jgi:ligand-binding sensor domain-containing protein|nr:hypothetical protein [Dysgonamonadaceae bacterium]
MKRKLTQLKTALLLVFLTVSGEMFSQLSDWGNYTCGNILAKMYNDGDYLWIATGGGLVKLNKATEEKTFHTRANTHGGLPENQLRTLTKDNEGNIWVGTEYNGISKFNEIGGISYFPEVQQCYAIKSDNENNIWFSGGSYLNKFDGTSLQKWTTYGSSLITSWYIYDLAFDKDSVLWMGGSMSDESWSGVYLAKFTEDGIQAVQNSSSGIIHNIELIMIIIFGWPVNPDWLNIRETIISFLIPIIPIFRIIRFVT